MKKSSMWLGIFMGTLMLIFVVACCTFAPSATNSNNVYANESEVNLETLSKAFRDHAKAGKKDLAEFEQRVNQKDIYSGDGYVRVTMDEKGTVIGYKDDDGSPGLQSTDTRVFGIDADPESKQIVAHDRHRRHYGLRTGDIATFYLMSRMMNSQRGYYGGRYYSSPTNAKWVQTGYHSRLKSSSSRSSRSVRSGSSRSSTSRSGSGGFGFGK